MDHDHVEMTWSEAVTALAVLASSRGFSYLSGSHRRVAMIRMRQGRNC